MPSLADDARIDWPAYTVDAGYGGEGISESLRSYLLTKFKRVVGSYGALAFSQRELGEPDREEVPKSVRASPGGYRSYHFWHSGYHGGK